MGRLSIASRARKSELEIEIWVEMSEVLDSNVNAICSSTDKFVPLKLQLCPIFSLSSTFAVLRATFSPDPILDQGPIDAHMANG